MSGDLIFLLVLIGFAVAVGLWVFTDEQREERAEDRDAQGAREARTQAQLDALRATRRIGMAFWRASRALHDTTRDARRDQNRDQDGR
ncbi:conserved hypothetical protein [Frankia sp. Hr75.2]|nr:conserved hypothetical protein [Frankia sp. Hr75.2]